MARTRPDDGCEHCGGEVKQTEVDDGVAQTCTECGRILQWNEEEPDADPDGVEIDYTLTDEDRAEIEEEFGVEW